jgi:hypothetical protein
VSFPSPPTAYLAFATNSWLYFESATINDTGVYSVPVTNVQWQQLETITVTNASAVLDVSPATAARHFFRARPLGP